MVKTMNDDKYNEINNIINYFIILNIFCKNNNIDILDKDIDKKIKEINPNLGIYEKYEKVNDLYNDLKRIYNKYHGIRIFNDDLKKIISGEH